MVTTYIPEGGTKKFSALLQNFCNKKQEIEEGRLKLYG
jgi:hypothetical protein